MNKEYENLRELAKEIAEIAHLPIQNEKKMLWTANNDLKPIRPMVYIDQLPWHEFKALDEMKLRCEDPFLRTVEQGMRETLYRWKHFPCDMVVENRIDIPKSVKNLNYGIHIIEEIRKTDEENNVTSHEYKDQLDEEEKLELLKSDEIQVDEESDQQRLSLCNEIFGHIIPVRLSGVQIHSGIWDRIAQMRPAESILWDLVDRPELITKTVKKLVDLTMSTIDQCENLGLLDPLLQYIHCSGAYTDDLPKDNTEDGKAKAQNVWSFGMAQLFSTVSPSMHEEFEIDLLKPLYERFGLMYYGCCEPLERKIDLIRKIKNIRKISVSPWADKEMCADSIGRDYVFSSKLNPAFISVGTFDEANIRTHMEESIRFAAKNQTPLEIILKDVSTLCGKLDYLDKCEQIIMNYVL